MEAHVLFAGLVHRDMHGVSFDHDVSDGNRIKPDYFEGSQLDMQMFDVLNDSLIGLAAILPVHRQEHPVSPLRTIRSISPLSPLQSISSHKTTSIIPPRRLNTSAKKTGPSPPARKTQPPSLRMTQPDSEKELNAPPSPVKKSRPLPRQKQRTPKQVAPQPGAQPQASSSRAVLSEAEEEPDELPSPVKQVRKKKGKSGSNVGVTRRGTRERKAPARFDDAEEVTGGTGRGRGRGRERK